MTMLNLVLIALLVIFLLLAIYIEWGAALRFSSTQFIVSLRRPPRKDLAIFIVLLLIVFGQQRLQSGNELAGWLLLGLILLTFWFGWIRKPVAIFKAEGVIINGRFIRWQQVRDYRLSEDGVLVLQLARERVLLKVKQLPDLEKIYQHITSQAE